MERLRETRAAINLGPDHLASLLELRVALAFAFEEGGLAKDRGEGIVERVNGPEGQAFERDKLRELSGGKLGEARCGLHGNRAGR